MNWDALGAIAELLGAVAVFFTLAYLALQVRQNANALRHQNEFSAAQIMQARTDTLINVSAAMLSNEQNLQVISNIGPELASRRDIDPADQQRANQVLNVFRSMFENIYEQHQRDLLAKSSIKAPPCAGWSILARPYWHFAHRCRRISKLKFSESSKTGKSQALTPKQ